MKKRYILHIRGKVQGVWYRASTREKAIELNIFGLVRNEPDGSVYVEIEGEEPKLVLMVAWCKVGPTHAQVESVEVQKVDPIGFTSFDILR